jgi:hypothetical protein
MSQEANKAFEEYRKVCPYVVFGELLPLKAIIRSIF